MKTNNGLIFGKFEKIEFYFPVKSWDIQKKGQENDKK